MPAQLFTLQGNAVASVAAIKTIEIIEKKQSLWQGNYCGKIYIGKIQKKSSYIGNIRCLGLSIGVDLEDKAGKYSSLALVKKICYRCFKRGLILIYLAGKTLRVQPPLIINDYEVEKSMDIIEDSFEELEEGK